MLFRSMKKKNSNLQFDLFLFWKMLTNALRIIVNNSFKESFYERKKKTINVLTTFSIFHKNCVKTFLK